MFPGQQDQNGDPSPEEIREMCRRIQDDWTVGQERQRRTGTSVAKPYEFPTVKEGCLIPDRQ